MTIVNKCKSQFGLSPKLKGEVMVDVVSLDIYDVIFESPYLYKMDDVYFI